MNKVRMVMALTVKQEFGDTSPVQDAATGQALFEFSSIDRFPGPAAAITANGDVLHANAQAAYILQALKTSHAGLTGLINRAVGSAVVCSQKLVINDNSGAQHLDTYALPVTIDGDPAVLVFMRDSTLEQNLTNALVESRQMFKDLLNCSADFAWETDTQGIFRYVSPRGAFGFAAHQLTGQKAGLHLQVESEIENPFSPRLQGDPQIITLRRNDGSRAMVHLSATPVQNQKGEWLGARGICRDISQSSHQNTNLHHLEARHDLVTRLAGLARDKADNDQILNACAATIRDALKADCWILRQTAETVIIDAHAVSETSETGADPDIDLPAIHQLLASTKGSRRSASKHIDGLPALLTPTRHHGVINGAILLVRGQKSLDEREFDNHELTMIEEAAEQLSLVLESVRVHAIISELTVTDDLTGLLNRRAFEKYANLRTVQQLRSGGQSSLLIMDVEDLEDLQKRHTHLSGNRVLRQISDLLRSRSREGDTIARLDGARFALWLDDTPATGAIAKARNIVRSCETISFGHFSGTTPISVHIGIASAEPDFPYTYKSLVDTAQNALLLAKRSAKGQFVVGVLPPLGDG